MEQARVLVGTSLQVHSHHWQVGSRTMPYLAFDVFLGWMFIGGGHGASLHASATLV